MNEYRICGAEATDTIEAQNMEDAIEQAKEWILDRTSPDHDRRLWLHAHIQNVAEEEEEMEAIEIALPAKAPHCSHPDGHDWQAPHHIVGGLAENPGVVIHGGGVIQNEVCMRCGCGKITDTWAPHPGTGQRLTNIEYAPKMYAKSANPKE